MISQEKQTKVMDVLLEDAGLDAYVAGPEGLFVRLTQENLTEAAEMLGLDVEELGWVELQDIAQRLGKEVDDLAREIARNWGLEPDAERDAEQMEDDYLLPVAAEESALDVIQGALVEKDGSLACPFGGAKCEACGVHGLMEDELTGDGAVRDYLDTCARLRVNPTPMEEIPTLLASVGGYTVACERCWRRAEELVEDAVEEAARRGYYWEDGSPVKEDDSALTIDGWDDLETDAIAYLPKSDDEPLDWTDRILRFLNGLLDDGTMQQSREEVN